MRSSTASRAVSTSTGTRLPAPRSRRHTSRPSMSGRPRSSTIASGSSAAAPPSACWPFSAVSTSCPARVSARRRASRSERSSSTTRIGTHPIVEVRPAVRHRSYLALTLQRCPPADDNQLALRLRGVVKHYGDVKAVDGLDLDLPMGTCVGLLGPNGAGKSTTMKMLTAQAIADAGRDRGAGPQAARTSPSRPAPSAAWCPSWTTSTPR